MKPTRRAYVLMGLWCLPKAVWSSDNRPISVRGMEEVYLEEIGIGLKEVSLVHSQRVREAHVESGSERIAFYVGDGLRDDALAQRFADAVMCSLALVHDTATEETPAAIGIDEAAIKKGRCIRIRDLLGRERIGSPLYFRVMSCVGVPSRVLDAVWRIVPVMVRSQPIMEAAHFYKESILQAWIADDDVFEFMHSDSDLPSSRSESVRVETAYQSAYKAIEAIIGEPPRDRRKLRIKLVQAGIDPDEEVGYELYGMVPGKEKIMDKLVNMRQARDKKVAHGKTSSQRSLGYCELKDKQAFACYFILTHIEFVRSGSK